MTDNARQSAQDKVSSAAKPDSQKTHSEEAGDYLKGKADSAASTVQPEPHKSMGQKVTDTVSGNKNENDQSMFESATETLGLGGNNK